MLYELNTQIGFVDIGHEHMGSRSCLEKILMSADDVLGSVTGRLDRKFHAAMERFSQEDPEGSSDIRLLKRTVLAIVSLGIVISALSLSIAVESQAVFVVFG